MKIKELWIEDYYLLQDFNITLDEQLIVLIGQNGSGKSTLLEFIAKIFYDLYEHFVLEKGEKPKNDFKLRYEIIYEDRKYQVYITANKKTKEYYEVNIKKNDENSKKYSKSQILKEFSNGYKDILPQNVVMYYSGISTHLENKFKEFQYKNFIQKSLDGEVNIEQPFFYFLPNNFSTILIGLLSYQFGDVPKILDEQFKISGFESINIVIKKPSWAKSKSKGVDFWGAKGDLATFLERMLAVLDENEREINDEYIIYSFHTQEQLEGVWEFYGEEKSFFEYLTTLQANDLIESIDIELVKNDKNISHKKLSEGEKQLLIVLGLKELLSTENTLFLLDEPDTYLHPKWQRDFVQNILIQQDTLDEKTSFIISSHSANIVSGLQKKQLKIMKIENSKVVLKEFSLNPYGKPVDDLLIDFFNLEGLRFREIDTEIKKLQAFLYSSEYEETKFLNRLEELGNKIGKDDIAYIQLKLEKAKRDKNEKNK
jgi:energy-coupling factor transporter ATP-binding protein EcfA2